MKRFIKKGSNRMNEMLDLLSMAKEHKKHHKFIVQNAEDHHLNDESLDVDEDSQEHEEDVIKEAIPETAFKEYVAYDSKENKQV